MNLTFRSMLIGAAMVLTPLLAHAQSSPGLYTGQVPTAAQWNSYFAAKQDALGYTPLNQAGGYMGGPLVTYPSASLAAGLNIPPGVAPNAPNSGDLWLTQTGGLYYQYGSTTIGPLVGAGPGSFAGTAPVDVTFPGNVTTYALNYDSNFATVSSNLAFAPIASGDLLGNCTGSSSEPTGCSWNSFALQAIGSTNGIIPYVSGGAWGTISTGTSGATIPLLNGANTWSGVQTHGTGDLVINGGAATAGLATVTTGGVVSSEANATVAQGGTGGTSASGTLLDNITGFSSTGLIDRTGAGAYSFTAPGTGVLTALGDATNAAGGISTYPVAQSTLSGLGTGVSTALGDNVGSAGAFVVNGGALGTPSSGTATSLTGLPLSTGITGFGANVVTALGNSLNTNGGVPNIDGSIVTGNCLKWGPGIEDSGGTCGSGGGGSPGGSSGAIQYNNGGSFGGVTIASGDIPLGAGSGAPTDSGLTPTGTGWTTQSPGTNNTTLATTAFVSGALPAVSLSSFCNLTVSGADITTCLQSAINAAQAAGACLVASMPPSVTDYEISSTIAFGSGSAGSVSPTQGYCLHGVVGASAAPVYGGNLGLYLKWNGSSGGTMFEVSGPLSGFDMASVMLNCNNTAAIGIQINGARDVRYIDNGTAACTSKDRDFEGLGSDTPSTNSVWHIISEGNYDTTSQANAIALNFDGVLLTYNSDVLESTFTQEHEESDGTDGVAVRLGYSDSLNFIGLHAIATGTGGCALKFDGSQSTGGNDFPLGIEFFGGNFFTGAGQQPTCVTGTIGINQFFGYGVGDGELTPTNANLIGTTNQGVPFPALTANEPVFGGGAGGAPFTSNTFNTALLFDAGLTVTSSFTATGLVTNGDLAHPSTTVNGQTCTLGSTCTITATAGSITPGSTTITSGTTNGLLYDNGGTLGNLATGNYGVLATGSGGVPAITPTPTLGGSGVLGSVTLGNATSGTVTLQPTTGALGTQTASLPANTGIIDELNYAATFSAIKTFGTGDLVINGGAATAGLATVTSGGVVSSEAIGAGVSTALGNAINAASGVPNIDGSITTGNCLKWGPGIEDSGGTCGGGGSTGANPSATAGPSANNGSATTFMRSDASPAVQKAGSSQFGLMEPDGTTMTCPSGVCSVPLLGVLDPTGQYGQTNVYIVNAGLSSGPTSGTLTANRFYQIPVSIPIGKAVTTIAFDVTTVGTGSCDVGIYNNVNGQPTTLVVDAGAVPTTSTGVITVTISQTLDNQWYFLAADCSSTTPAVVAQNTTYGSPVLGYNFNGASSAPIVALFRTLTYGTPPFLPSDESTETYSQDDAGTLVPVMGIH